MSSAAARPGDELTGLSGAVSDVISALGETGVLLLTFAETVFPPVPSEIVLPLAGYLSNRGQMSVAVVFLAATLGSVLGAWALYAAGARMGLERSSRWLAALPLVDREDVDKSVHWFDRHGQWAILIGRLVPGVRSLISLPAGASRMGAVRFTVYTTIGSALWNALLVGAGYALGSQYQRVEEYAGWIDKVAIAALVAVVLWLVARRVRKRRRATADRG